MVYYDADKAFIWILHVFFVGCGTRKWLKKNLKLDQENSDNVNKKMLHNLFFTELNFILAKWSDITD